MAGEGMASPPRVVPDPYQISEATASRATVAGSWWNQSKVAVAFYSSQRFLPFLVQLRSSPQVPQRQAHYAVWPQFVIETACGKLARHTHTHTHAHTHTYTMVRTKTEEGRVVEVGAREGRDAPAHTKWHAADTFSQRLLIIEWLALYVLHGAYITHRAHRIPHNRTPHTAHRTR